MSDLTRREVLKTTALEGLYYLSEFGRDRSKHRSRPERLSLRHCTSGTDRLMLKGGDDGNSTTITANSENLSVASEREGGKNQFSVDTKAYERGVEAKHGGPPDFGPALLLRLDLERLTAPSYSDEAVPQMMPDGQGLASVLAYIATNRPQLYKRVTKALQSVIPSFQDMRFPRASVKRAEVQVIKHEGKEFTHHAEREYWGNSIQFDMQGARRLPAEMISEGTLLVLGLLTAIIGPNHPQLLLLDGLARALHHRAQKDLVALLRRLLKHDRKLQIVATTHSPYLLDHFRPEEVRLTTRQEDGSVAVGRLDQHPDFEKWKEEMSPGEFWSLVGEEWVAKATVEK